METLTLTKKSMYKLQLTQCKMERSMLDITTGDKIINKEMPRRSEVKDAGDYIL